MTNEFEKAGIRNRVSKDEIDSLITHVDYYVFSNTTVTVCLIWLKNGSKVLGVNYGRILPEEQNWEMGKQEAYKDAYSKIWELEGYLVRENLHDYIEGKKLYQAGASETITEEKAVNVNTGFNQLIEYPGIGN